MKHKASYTTYKNDLYKLLRFTKNMNIFTNKFKIKLNTLQIRKFARGADCLVCMIQDKIYKFKHEENDKYRLQFYDDKWIDSRVFFDKDYNLYEEITNLMGDTYNIFQPSEYEIDFEV